MTPIRLQQEIQYRRMTQLPLKRLLVSQSLPTVISMVCLALGNLAETGFIALAADNGSARTAGFGAIGCAFPVVALIQAVGFTVGTGAGSLLSRALGSEDRELAEKYGASAFWFSLALGGVLGAVGLMNTEPLALLLGADRELLPITVLYLRFLLPAAPGMIASLVLSHLLRGEGHSFYAMIGALTGVTTGMGLLPLVLLVFDMGATGVALALFCGQWVTLIAQLAFYWKGRTLLRLSVRGISHTLRDYGEILTTGAPSFFRQGLICFSTLMMNRVAATMGGGLLAAVTVASRVFAVPFGLLLGIGQGYQPIVGYNYTAKQVSRIKDAFGLSLKVSTVLAVLMGAGLFWQAPAVLERMGASDPKIWELGIFWLRVQCAALPLIPLNMLCNMTYQSMGKKITATVLSCCRQGICFFPLLLLLPRIYGALGLLSVQGVADAVTFLVTIPVLIGGLGREWNGRSSQPIRPS